MMTCNEIKSKASVGAEKVARVTHQGAGWIFWQENTEEACHGLLGRTTLYLVRMMTCNEIKSKASIGSEKVAEE